MPVLKAVRLVLVALAALLAIPAATVHAAQRMPIGFFDDPSFRWSPTRDQNLQLAAVGRGVRDPHDRRPGQRSRRRSRRIPRTATTRRTSSTDLDDLVFQAGLHGLRVMINITGTPKWANGGKAPNVMPKKLGDLTTFAKMLATRYNGRTGHGSVSLWSVWNEPNLQLFLTPQFVGKKIVGPANYAKLFKAAYAGIKAGNPLAKVAIGETSAPRTRQAASGRQRDHRARHVRAAPLPGQGAQVRRVGASPVPDLAEPAADAEGSLSERHAVDDVDSSRGDLKKWFHRSVPIWITEYGHETKPAEPHGVTHRAAGGLREAGAGLREEGSEHPDVHLVRLPRQRRQPLAERADRAVGHSEAGAGGASVPWRA